MTTSAHVPEAGGQSSPAVRNPHDDEADVPADDEFADPDDLQDVFDEMNRRHRDRWDEQQAEEEEGPPPDFESSFDIAGLSGRW